MKTVVWTVSILSLLFLASAMAQDGLPNLTGKWVLNEKMSDDFAAVMKEAKSGGSEMPQGGGRGGGGKGGGGRGGGMGGGGKGGGGSRGDSEERQAKAQERMDRALKEYSHLEIYHAGIELNVTNGLDISHLLYTDGNEMTIWTQRGEAKATATWREDILVVEWKTRQDTVSRIREYTLGSEGRILTMIESLQLPGQDKSIEMTMVYELEE